MSVNTGNALLPQIFSKQFPASPEQRDKTSYTLLSWLFLRGLALIYLAAFASMAVQIDGLIGSNGILPLQSMLKLVAAYYPETKFLKFPTLFWFDASDQMLTAVCYAGMIAAVLLLLNVFSMAVLPLLYLLYLSITVAGQDFTAFQWDSFLLEAGFLAIFLPWGSKIIIFLYRWLLARFMFMGGVVKLASGDPSWVNLTALSFHYQTQPLPSPIAYYAHHLPLWLHQLSAAGVFFIELLVPFFVFLTRPLRIFAAWSFIVLQSSIILTGNYNFFNLLTILLCVFLFDDKDAEKCLPARWVSTIRLQQSRAGPIANTIAAVWLGVVLATCATHVWMSAVKRMPVQPFKSLIQMTRSFSLVNNYGPFAVMTTERPEIIIQGSYDSQHWYTYKFHDKPVDLEQNLSWVIPHQPRLDWQMWFAALSNSQQVPWFSRFMRKLREGSPQVQSLLAVNPFQNKPPVFLRALLYRYKYSTPEQRLTTGQIWQREYLGVYWLPGN